MKEGTYYSKNREKMKAYSKAYYQLNKSNKDNKPPITPEKIILKKKYGIAYRAKNRDKLSEYHKIWYKANRERVCAMNYLYARRIQEQEKILKQTAIMTA